MEETTSNLKGKRVTVMGLGTFGGGIGVVQFLISQGAKITLTDLRDESELRDSLQQVDTQRIDKLVLGTHCEEDFCNADLIVASPGIHPDRNKYLQTASHKGIPISTEINLFWERCLAKKIVVTGSVGKSTTTSLIHHLLSASGVPCRLGGNIGISLLTEVDSFSNEDWAVLELSSFQLEHLASQHPRPDVAVVTNFSPNHLDWHGSMEAYQRAKQNALKWQTAGDVCVLNADDPASCDWLSESQRILFGSDVSDGSIGVKIDVDRFSISNNHCASEILFEEIPDSLRSSHQLQNVAAALAAVTCRFSLHIDDLKLHLKTFPGLPHRLEVVGSNSGIQCINDSKATTPEATIAAIKSINSPIVLIAGGKDKQLDMSDLCELICQRVKSVALIGETANAMGTLLKRADSPLFVEKHNCLADAFTCALDKSAPGDVILFSPACSSDGEFRNYEERGIRFRALVQATAFKGNN